MQRKQKQRGSIEVVILVIVFAVAIGLIVWRYSEAEKAQIAAENAADSQPIATAPVEKKQTVTISEMGLTFEVPESAGEITYSVNESGAAQLMASKLAEAESECPSDHDGKFALLRTANADDVNVSDDYKATVDNTQYVLQVDYQSCYHEAEREEFDEVAKAIASTLKRTEGEAVTEE